MRRSFAAVVVLLALAAPAGAANKPHYAERAETIAVELCQGKADLSLFDPLLRLAMDADLRRAETYCAVAGGLKRVEFVDVEDGDEVYRATFAEAGKAWWIRLTPEGTIARLFFQ